MSNSIRVFRGNQTEITGRFGIVVSRYNESVTSKLLDGAIESLTSQGIAEDALDVVWVPGAWEIPIVARRLAQRKNHLAIVCLGAVIRGETSHDQHINRAVSTAIMRISLRYDLPVLFGLLTCDTLEQAIHRAGGNVGNKGSDCARAALEMVNLMSQLPPGHRAGTKWQRPPSVD